MGMAAAWRAALNPGLSPCLSHSSSVGNDSCGVDADTRHNDTDQCWGPLRRVDAYRIYLVSALSPAPAAPGA